MEGLGQRPGDCLREEVGEEPQRGLRRKGRRQEESRTGREGSQEEGVPQERAKVCFKGEHPVCQVLQAAWVGGGQRSPLSSGNRTLGEWLSLAFWGPQSSA